MPITATHLGQGESARLEPRSSRPARQDASWATVAQPFLENLVSICRSLSCLHLQKMVTDPVPPKWGAWG